MLILTDAHKIPLEDIADIECELFTGFLGGDDL